MTIQINGTSGISGVDGSAATPALQGTDTNTGISFGTDEVKINTGGTTRATVDSSGRLGIGTTTVGHKLDLLVGGGADGVNVYNNATGAAYYQLATTSRSYKIEAIGSDLRFYDNTGSAERARIDSSGRLLVGTSSWSAGARSVIAGNSSVPTGNGVLTISRGTDTAMTSGDPLANIEFTNSSAAVFARISVEADGTTGTTTDLPGRILFWTTADGASSPSERWRIDNAGSLVGVAGSAFVAPYVYNSTTATAANVNVDATGFLRRSTSSIKYKTNVETIEDQYADAILGCRPVWYQSTCEADKPEWGHWGFIAEEVAVIDPRLCFFKEEEDGTLEPEGVQYDRFVPHLLNLIKRQGEAIADLQAEVAALKAQ